VLEYAYIMKEKREKPMHVVAVMTGQWGQGTGNKNSWKKREKKKKISDT